MKRAATLQDVAERLGVSAATASAALRNTNGSVRFSQETRVRALKVAKDLDYRPNRLARAMATGVVPVVAVALQVEKVDTTGIHLYLHDALPSAGLSLHELGMEMLFLPYRDHVEEIAGLKTLIADRLIGGVVSNIIAGRHDLLIKFLRKVGIPFVLMGKGLDDSVVSVAEDDAIVQNTLRRYARSQGLHRVLNIGAHYREGAPTLMATDPRTLAERAVTDEELRATDTLLAIGGALPECVADKLNDIPASRKILVEDARLWHGVRPAVLARATTGRRASLAAEILVHWIGKGKPPCQGRQTVQIEADEVEMMM